MMSSRIFRTKKSEFILSSFYFLTFFILLSYAFIFARTIFFGFMDVIDGRILRELISILLYTGEIFSLSLLISLPFSMLLTVFLVLCDGHPLGSFSEKFLYFLVKVPLLIVGLPILFWLRQWNDEALIMALLGFITIPRWSLRWLGVTRKVRPAVVEASLSIGMGFWQVLYYIYLKKCYKDFLRHSLVMLISLVGLITPFLYLVESTEKVSPLLSFVIFRNILEDPQSSALSSSLVLVLMFLSLINVFLGYSKESYGEWNG